MLSEIKWYLLSEELLIIESNEFIVKKIKLDPNNIPYSIIKLYIKCFFICLSNLLINYNKKTRIICY